MYTSSGRPLCIIGNVVDDQGRESMKSILVQHGRIVAIQPGKVPFDLPNLILLELADDEVVFPGLINLHVHSEYNIFPLWKSPAVWSSRFQWRNNEQYFDDIKRFKEYIDTNWKHESYDFIQSVLYAPDSVNRPPLSSAALADAMREVLKLHGIVTELQAVAGGTTLVQQTIRLESNGKVPNFIIRDTTDPTELGIPDPKKVFSVVDFVKPGPDFDAPGAPERANDDTSGWPMMQLPSFDDFVTSVREGNSRYYACIAHLAEGRAGYLQKGRPDGFSRREFQEFQRVLTPLAEAGLLKNANLTLTHACGLDYSDKSTLDFLLDNRISVVWSPVSNLLLYRDTIPVKQLLDHGINVCLGSDWAPSGSKHVWDEFKFAWHFCDALNIAVSDTQLLAMMTQNPATALGSLRVGSIKTGYNADFFMLRKQTAQQPALAALHTQDDRAVRCTIVNGRIVYGDKNLFDTTLPVDYESIPASEGQIATQKAVSINSTLNFNLIKALSQVDILMYRYTNDIIRQPWLRRTKMLSSDDFVYQRQITQLKSILADLIKG